ncbi:MAG: hypothetical protein AAGI68_16855 [Planctomycetota bacterium]
MLETNDRVDVAGVDWAGVFGWVRVLRGWRMAWGPGKLGVALLGLVLFYGGGVLMDAGAVGRGIGPKGGGQLGASGQMGEGGGVVEMVASDDATRVEEAVVLGPFGMLWNGWRLAGSEVRAGVLDLRFGRDGVLGGVTGVVGSTVVAWRAWPVWGTGLAVWGGLIALFVGGVIGRVSAEQAASGGAGQAGSVGAALRWVGRMSAWLVLVWVGPAVLVGLLAGGLWAVGWLFAVPGLDVVGGFGYGLMLAAGVLGTVLLGGLVLGGPMLVVGLAVEGSDGFDVVSRVYHYVVFHFVRYVWCGLVVVVAGVLGYAVLGVLVGVAMEGVGRLTGAPGAGGVVASEAGTNVGLAGTGRYAAALVTAWSELLRLGLLAVLVSYGVSAWTWVYLVLREAADGTGPAGVDAVLDERRADDGETGSQEG